MERNLKPPAGARHKKKRMGCGLGSGHGRYSGRGQKGQKSRSGRSVRIGFEGGQLPLIQRLPRQRGFTNIFKVVYEVVNVRQLGVFPAGAEVGPAEMFGAGLVRNPERPVKILGTGDIGNSLHVKASKFSQTAEKKITEAGGKAEVI